MGIAVFVESDNGAYKKSCFEAISLGKRLASKNGGQCVAISIGEKGSENLGVYGADSHIHISGDVLNSFNPQAYADAMHQAVSGMDIDTILVSLTYSGKSLAPILAVKWGASILTGVVGVDDSAGLTFKKTCFSNKAFAHVNLSGEKNVVGVIPNSFEISSDGSDVQTEDKSVSLSADSVNTSIKDTRKVSGKVVLTEAELVVSGGRGLKGPENWGMIEELADIIGAATACSKPVSDMDWRPHNEHVGQTGITIKPNLYIAIGISGAIQHLAGVGSSKVICVINTDPEAPFFKAADYGIVGDAFEVVPKLIKRAKEIKGMA